MFKRTLFLLLLSLFLNTDIFGQNDYVIHAPLKKNAWLTVYIDKIHPKEDWIMLIKADYNYGFFGSYILKKPINTIRDLSRRWIQYRKPSDSCCIAWDYNYWNNSLEGQFHLPDTDIIRECNIVNDKFRYLSIENGNSEKVDSSKRVELNIEKCRATDKIELQGRIDALLLNDTANVFTWVNGPVLLGADSCVFKSIYFRNCEFKNIDIGLSNTLIDSLHLIDSKFENHFELSNLGQNKEHPIILSIDNVDPAKLKFDYSKYQLDTSQSEFNHLHLSELYTSILRIQNEFGYIDGYEKADIELKQLHYKHLGVWGNLLNAVDRIWWNYGYKRQLIVRNSLMLMLLFFIMNLLCFKKLIFDTYPMVKFQQIYQSRISNKPTSFRLISTYSAYCFLFTGFIFWNIRLSVENLEIRRLGLVAWVIFQFTTGFICLAYLVGYIIAR